MVPLARLELFKFARCYTRFHALPLMRCHLLHVLKSSRKQNFWITKHITMCGAQHIVITIEKEYELIFIVLLGSFFLQKTRNSAVLLLILFHFGDIGESCFAFVSIWTDWHLAWKGDRKPLKYLNSIQLLAQPGKLLQFLDTTHSSSQVLLVIKGTKIYFFFFTLFTFSK